MKTWQWIVFVLISYLVFLIAYFPASYVAAQIHAQTNQQVNLMQVTGTLFNGKAAAIEANGFRVNNIEWSLNPLSLLLLNAEVSLKGGAIRDSEQIYVDGEASVNLLSVDSFSLSDTQIFVPAKAVLSQFKLPVAVTANGRFRVDIDQLEMTPTCTLLQGTGAWLNAEVDTPQQAVNLGSFNADLSCQGGNLTVSINEGNNLQLTGLIVVDSTGKYSINGQFLPNDELPSVIRQAADSFFQRNGQGFYQIRL
jgi:general secretion pathway protein N